MVLRAAHVSMPPRSDGMYRQGWEVHPGYMLPGLPGLKCDESPAPGSTGRAQRSPAPAPEPEPEPGRHGSSEEKTKSPWTHTAHGSSNTAPPPSPVRKGGSLARGPGYYYHPSIGPWPGSAPSLLLSSPPSTTTTRNQQSNFAKESVISCHSEIVASALPACQQQPAPF